MQFYFSKIILHKVSFIFKEQNSIVRQLDLCPIKILEHFKNKSDLCTCGLINVISEISFNMYENSYPLGLYVAIHLIIKDSVMTNIMTKHKMMNVLFV